MVKIRCFEDVEGKTLVTGFLGLGHVGFLSVDHMIKTLEAKRVGYVETIYVPPFVTVRRGGHSLPYEIFAYENAAFFRFEFTPTGKGGTLIMRSVVEWAKEEGIEKMLLLGGLNTSLRKQGEKAYIRYLCNTHWLERFETLQPPLQEGVQVVGPLSLLLNYAKIYGVPALSLLSYANPATSDPRAAAYAVEAAAKLLEVVINVKDLLNKAVVVEKELEKLATLTSRKDISGGESMYA